jgi:hypothetical protein
MDHMDQHLATAVIENEYCLAIKAALAITKKPSIGIMVKLIFPKSSGLLWVRN